VKVRRRARPRSTFREAPLAPRNVDGGDARRDGPPVDATDVGHRVKPRRTAILGAMVDVCLLGTGTPEPDPGRAGSGIAVVHDGDWLLVDCGRGVAQRTMQAGLDLLRLKAVLLTHHHSTA
jgi:hypothetical protein